VAWIPACAGMTPFYEIIKFDEIVKSRHSGGNGSAELAEDRSPENF
jgi:hypothetical protein